MLLQTDLEPIPGDLIVARIAMRSWESDDVRGRNGLYVKEGEQALVIATWTVGNQFRLRVVRDQRILLFSHPVHVVRVNWAIAHAAPRLPNLVMPVISRGST